MGQFVLTKSGLNEYKIVEYSAFERTIKINSKLDFADVKITFDDLPGQSVTLKELRPWIQAQPHKIGH